MASDPDSGAVEASASKPRKKQMQIPRAFAAPDPMTPARSFQHSLIRRNADFQPRPLAIAIKASNAVTDRIVSPVDNATTPRSNCKVANPIPEENRTLSSGWSDASPAISRTRLPKATFMRNKINTRNKHHAEEASAIGGPTVANALSPSP